MSILQSELQESLLALDYQKIVQDENHFNHCTNVMFQKGVRDSEGIMYFINVYYYPERSFDTVTMKESIQVECSFNWGEDDAFSVTLMNSNIEECETQLNKMFHLLELEHYYYY